MLNQLIKAGISPVFNPHIPMAIKTEHNKIIFIASQGDLYSFISVSRAYIGNKSKITIKL